MATAKIAKIRGGGSKIRLIVPSRELNSVLQDLTEMDQKYNLDVLCLAPIYKTAEGQQIYNINRMLGYFRKKLLRGSVPTIFANECAAGRIYEQLGLAYASPTINTYIDYEDFIKFCHNPQKYLAIPAEKMYWVKRYHAPDRHESEYVPATKLDDVEVIFSHDDNIDAAKERWNFLRQHINWERIVYVMADAQGTIPLDILRRFAKLDGQKLLFYYHERYSGAATKDLIIANRVKFIAGGAAIENEFDMLGWINGDYLHE